MDKIIISGIEFGVPELCQYHEYLNNLRESGITNMFGAGEYLQQAFPVLSKPEAQIILKNWMDTFKQKEVNNS